MVPTFPVAKWRDVSGIARCSNHLTFCGLRGTVCLFGSPPFRMYSYLFNRFEHPLVSVETKPTSLWSRGVNTPVSGQLVPPSSSDLCNLLIYRESCSKEKPGARTGCGRSCGATTTCGDDPPCLIVPSAPGRQGIFSKIYPRKHLTA
jgi:hypothetical protein